jgi:2,6-dihydroxypyridine 3-monooxygenase
VSAHRDHRQRVTVVGGSLGGLTAALLLRDLGFEVDLYERTAAELWGFGAGIVVHEKTMRYFRERSSLDLSTTTVPASHFRFVDMDGEIVHDEPSPYEFTSWGTLYGCLMSLYDPERYHRGHELIGIIQDANGVEAIFANGRRVRSDLLICADGIQSTARRLLAPEVALAYSGYVGWRGTVEEGRLTLEMAEILADSITYGILDHSHVLSYPIQNHLPSGRSSRLLNYVWYRNLPEGPELDALMVDRHGTKRAISIQPGELPPARIAELGAAADDLLPPVIASLVRMAEQPFIQAVVDISSRAMVYGRVCLIGDAAFAARPHAAAGTAKAAENCWTLAAALAQNADLDEALASWEPSQLALGNELVARSRRIGEEYQLRGAAIPGDPELRFGLYGPDR